MTIEVAKKQTITMQMLCKRLNRTPQCINGWVRSGFFPAPIRTSTGTTIGWSEEQYDSWVAKNTR